MNNRKQITPLPYVFHVSYSRNRKSILKNGLIGNTIARDGLKDSVYAHNNYSPNFKWYPFCIDGWEWEPSNISFNNLEDQFTYCSNKYGYDFWRIDTKKINNKWYVDEVGMLDFNDGVNYPFLIVTEGNIPSKAIELFAMHDEVSIFKTDGVAHVTSRFRQCNTLLI